MANEKVVFKRGTTTNLPTTKTPGNVLVDISTGAMYVDDTSSSRIQIKDPTKLGNTETAVAAKKLSNTSAIGSETNPVYFNASGVPVKTTYTLASSVPADAKFTDTVYTHPSYTARTGVPTANQTPAFGGTFTVSQPVSDASGHITAINSRTITIPGTTMTAATADAAGTKGLVPAPAAGKQTSFLRGDGTWATPTNTDTKVTQTNTTTSADYRIILSANANDTTETATARKSANFLANPSTGVMSISTTKFGGLQITRDGSSFASVVFKNVTNGILGSIGMNTANGYLYRHEFTDGNPDTAAMVLDEQNTSFTASLTSGTKVGSIKIAGTSKDIYAPTVPTSLKNPNALTVKGNGTASFTYDGSAAKTLNIKPGTGISVSSDTSGNITITNTSTNTDTKVTISTTNPTSSTNYYPTFATGAGTGGVSLNNGLVYTSLEGTTSALGYSIMKLGNSTASGTAGNKYGRLDIYSESSSYGSIKQANTTSAITHTLPATTGTILNTGTTSFTRSLTSGTKIGSIKINGTSTDIYAPTNTNTTYTLSGAYGSSSNTWVTTLTPSSGDATTSTVPTASTSVYGITKLSSATNSTSTALAATASAVKSAYDLANGKSTVSFSRSLTSGTKVGTITIDGTATDIYCNNNTDTKVTSTTTNPTDATTYYPTWVTGATTGTVLINNGITYGTLEGTTSAVGYGILKLGNSTASGTAGNKYGRIDLFSESSSYGYIKQANTTSAVAHTLPATSGTILNTGTTSFTASLTSGTKIGTLKINGTSTDLYCQTNTNTTYTFASGTTKGAFTVTPSGGSAQTVSIYGLGSAAYTDASTYLPLAGGTMTGPIKYNSGSRTSTPIKIIDGDENGAAMVIGGTGGLTVLGGGESANSLVNLIDTEEGFPKIQTGSFAYTSEDLILSADTGIYFMTNCNTVADRKIALLSADLNLYPGTTNTGNIGTSSYKWSNMYATTFHGALDGNATSATKVYGTLTNPTSETTYAIPFHTNVSSENKSLLNNDGLRYLSLQGTASAEGKARLYLGNDVATGTAGNKTGNILLYGDSTYYGRMTPASGMTAHRTWTFPDATGTVALTSQLSDKYVLQSASTTDNYRPLLMGYANSTTVSSLTATNTNQAYVVDGIYCKPSEGALYTNAITVKNEILNRGRPCSTSSTSGATGYYCIAQFVITSTYLDTPIEVEVSDRGKATFTTFAIRFTNTNSTDPALSLFRYRGVSLTAYMCKSDTSTWQLWVNATATYSNIAIHSIKSSYLSKFTVTYPQTYLSSDDFATAIADGGTLATYTKASVGTEYQVSAAAQWISTRCINGMVVNGTADRMNYGTCSTAAGTAAKVVDCTGFSLKTGSEITVKFTVTNTASSPTLNVNSTGAKAIYYRGSAISASYLGANRTYTFRYNGTQYELVGDVNTNTDTKVTQTNLAVSTTSNTGLKLPLLLANKAANSNNSYANETREVTCTTTTNTANMTGLAWLETNYYTTGGTPGTSYAKICCESFKCVGDGQFEGNAYTATRFANTRTINGVDFDGTANISITKALYSGTGASSVTTVDDVSNYDLLIIVASAPNAGNVVLFHRTSEYYVRHPFCTYPNPAQGGSNTATIGNMMTHATGTTVTATVSNILISGSSSAVSSSSSTYTSTITEVYGLKFS